MGRELEIQETVPLVWDKNRFFFIPVTRDGNRKFERALNAYFLFKKSSYLHKVKPLILEQEREKTKQIVSQLFGTETGISKKLSHYLEQEQETQNKLSHCLGKRFQGIPIGKYMGTGNFAHSCVKGENIQNFTYKNSINYVRHKNANINGWGEEGSPVTLPQVIFCSPKIIGKAQRSLKTNLMSTPNFSFA